MERASSHHLSAIEIKYYLLVWCRCMEVAWNKNAWRDTKSINKLMSIYSYSLKTLNDYLQHRFAYFLTDIYLFVIMASYKNPVILMSYASGDLNAAFWWLYLNCQMHKFWLYIWMYIWLYIWFDCISSNLIVHLIPLHKFWLYIWFKTTNKPLQNITLFYGIMD